MDIFTGGAPDDLDDIFQGPDPFVTNLKQDTVDNTNFFTARWTGRNMQLGLMNVPVNSDTGLDMRQNTDQFYYIERGYSLIVMGASRDHLDFQAHAHDGFSILVPAGTWHNIVNVGYTDLKIFVIMSPPFLTYNTIFEKFEDWIPSKYL